MAEKGKLVFPRKAWVLQPSYKPKEVTFVRRSVYSDNHDITDTDKHYHIDEIYSTKEDAIGAGYAKITAAESDLAKRRENLNKKLLALDKASKTKE